ncbi:Molybdate-binding periplasmic protein precursor [Mycobacterium marinum]|uniref:molybdate ABC transporter substrate-binding protein n=1 Tax=Mycobacterium marinum TaxID=1781 RepID=UPI0003FBA8FB|nr:molybdate ABC transporter substrate-binding protein [Mycobacterium marinum]RFZ13633.1 Molybdate-binding periplasmic protein precursor [Mycobacterium marinum]WCS16056.1 molybdate ABC transporter substrate-binding protein [Mycobacterium marinum]WOR07034.1 molybdate ABC transporter substrate-binding protein [Mycobacterium marinum]CDM76799.1 molybdate-binding lipoprotein ModA [Mycobacterium marinum E11]BBC65925.1 molybdate-binding protein [Mycobacterium marinum]
MTRVGMLAGMVSALLVWVVGCGSPSRPAEGARSITIFAAASLKTAFTQIGERFKTANPGVGVELDFAGSSELATQLTQGATADVFASADTAQMDTVAKAGLLAADPTNFASNTLVIVTAPGNPKHVGSFADLSRSDLTVVVCQQQVPCGAATQRIEDGTGVHLNPVSEELSVTDVLNKVTTGQSDAALVYLTDAMSAGSTVSTIKFPQAAPAVNVYPIAVLSNAPQPGLARKFVDMVTAETGRRILDRSGFAKP